MSGREVYLTDERVSPKRGEMVKIKKERSYSRSPSRGRGRDRERDHHRDYSHRRDRSRSRSRSGRRRKYSRYSRSPTPDYRRSHSHSPMSSRKRHLGTRDQPLENRCLGVFALSVKTTDSDLYEIFSKYGPVERVQVVIDAKTGRSRGFAFVYFVNIEDAKVAKEHCNGMKIDGNGIRVDYSITERPHTPTPGVYMGKPTHKYDRYESRSRRYRDRDDYYHSSRYSRRSPSPYYSSKSRRRHSRSRSYSPRRY